MHMLRLMLGSETFETATRLYFSCYRNTNANTDQFFECFEEVRAFLWRPSRKSGWNNRVMLESQPARITTRPLEA
ncbi:MAG: hypothetical protein ACUVSA_06050 [Desulfosoma sp.]|uniref:hypothetical protein n=1 Tax=Desulfosoma sp. TaxID=2603217 RepID=UPI0040498C17